MQKGEAEELYTGRCYAGIANKINSGEFLLCDKPKRSKVWALFSKVVNKDGEELDFVRCKKCEKIYKYNHSQTSNLCKHICYIEKFANTENEASYKEEESLLVQIDDVAINKLTQLLTKWLIHNCYSSDIIQTEGLKAIFLELLKLGAKFGSNIDLNNLLPSFSEVSKNLSETYNYFCESIKLDLVAVKQNGFGLTVDIWTDNITNENYMALAVHYCKNSELTSRLLGFQLLEGAAIADENVTEMVKSILEKFDCELSDKCIFIINGSSSSIKALPDLQNLPCVSQLLNKALLESMEKTTQVWDIINSCSKLMHFLKKKASNNLLWKLRQKSHHNRCLAIYKMLSLILINWDEIEQVIKQENVTQNFTITKNKLKAVENVLQPFVEAIETLEDDTNATLHLVMAYMHELRKFCHVTINEHNFGFVKNLQEHIRLNLEETVMKNITTLHKIAVFLYPPTNKLLPYSDKEKQSVEDECIRLMKFYRIETKPLIKQEPDDEPVSSLCKRRKLFADFLESEQNYDTNEIIRQEIQNYKNTRVIFSLNFNVFNWWELQKDNFPLLYKLSCTVLATPATSAALKRVFSNAKSLISEKLRLNSWETDIETIMFISTNAAEEQLDQYFAG